MGKPSGFMEYDRKGNPALTPEERVKNWNEFHPMLDAEARRTQAARCMNCGVPFCQAGENIGGAGFSGCPLHNLIPEWNDMLYLGNWDHALARLRKTSNFPEFTGRVCPALCEAGCTCGLNDSPVTVRENELALIEYGFAHGLVKPEPPKTRTGKKVAVIGSGPAGLACADLLNRRGHSVTVYERDDRPGGLLMYGIPNMKLEKEIVLRRIHLMEEEGIRFVCGADVGKDIDATEIMAEYDAAILCCGAKKARDLAGEGREKCNGIYFAVDFLSRNTKSLLDSNLTDGQNISAKGKHVVVVGGGDTGNDCIGTCIRQGCASVTALEMMPAPPEKRAESNPWPQWPRVKKTDYGHEEAIAVFGKDPRRFQTTVKEFIPDENGQLKEITIVKLKAEQKDGRMRMVEVAGSEEKIPCGLLLIAAGFTGCEEYVPEAFGVSLTARGTVKTEDDHAHVGGKIFTAGDMRRGQSLVVWAMAEGRNAAREADEYMMQYSGI